MTATTKEDRMTFDKEVTRVLEQMNKMSVDSDEYAEAAKSLKTLCEARGVKTTRSISADTLIAAGANLLGIVLILNYEQVHVITTKAISLVLRGGRS